MRRTLWIALAGALVVTACGGSSGDGQKGTDTTVPASTTTPATMAPLASRAEFCHRFTDTVLRAAREHWNDAQAEAAYRALAGAGRGVDAQTANDVAELADAMAAASTTSMSLQVSNATSTVLARCKRLGYPLTAAQLTELRQLLIQTFQPSTTTTSAP